VRALHVAVDAHNLARDDRGIGRYARAVLMRALHAPDVRFTFVVRALLPNRRAVSGALGYADVRVANRVPRDADVVWFPWNGTFLATDAPHVATVHDAAPFAFPARDPRVRAREQGPFLATAATARRILVQSQFTAGEVEGRLDVPRDRIVVTPLACDAVFSPGVSDGLPPALRGRRYVLHVGAHDERKNTPTLIAAHARAFPDADVALVFTRRPPQVPATGVVVEARNDDELVALYRGATLVALPSTYEGFGFPLLEALACGAPALAARAGALPEVGGDACAYVDDAHDVAAWTAALRRLFADDAQRARLAAAGPSRAATFSWERCTEQTLAVLREVGEGGG
jgi:alpha-1,3-rhamnosyl/mannosyltransferase